jgi:hypothetical protein
LYFCFVLSQSCHFIVQVVVTAGVRPSMEHFERYSETVPHNIPPGGQEGDSHVLLVDGKCQLDNAWFFVGVLPHLGTLQVQNIYLNFLAVRWLL